MAILKEKLGTKKEKPIKNDVYNGRIYATNDNNGLNLHFEYNYDKKQYDYDISKTENYDASLVVNTHSLFNGTNKNMLEQFNMILKASQSPALAIKTEETMNNVINYIMNHRNNVFHYTDDSVRIYTLNERGQYKTNQIGGITGKFEGIAARFLVEEKKNEEQTRGK